MVARLVVVAGGLACKYRDLSMAAFRAYFVEAGNCLHPDLRGLMVRFYSSYYIVFSGSDCDQETKCHLQILVVIDQAVAVLDWWEAKHEKVQ